MVDYPEIPGFKENDTSREAAEHMVSRASNLRAQTLAFIKGHPGHTADQIAAALDQSPLSIRPRISELRSTGAVVNEGRGINIHSGRAAHRWKSAMEHIDV